MPFSPLLASCHISDSSGSWETCLIKGFAKCQSHCITFSSIPSGYNGRSRSLCARSVGSVVPLFEPLQFWSSCFQTLARSRPQLVGHCTVWLPMHRSVSLCLKKQIKAVIVASCSGCWIPGLGRGNLSMALTKAKPHTSEEISQGDPGKVCAHLGIFPFFSTEHDAR